MKLTPSQRMMHDDGLPLACFMTQDQRAKVWAKRPPRAMPLFQLTPKDEDADTAAFRAQEVERKRLKSLASISRMKTRIATKAVNHKAMRWDPRKAKFVPDTGTISKLGSSERLGPQYDGTRSMNSNSMAGRRHEPDTLGSAQADWSRVTKDNARELLMLNKVWHEKHDKLTGGLLVMTARNLLKGLIKKGGEVRWN